jgi:hypothetical protein
MDNLGSVRFAIMLTKRTAVKTGETSSQNECRYPDKSKVKMTILRKKDEEESFEDKINQLIEVSKMIKNGSYLLSHGNKKQNTRNFWSA